MTDDTPKIASTLERTKLFMVACLIFVQGPLMFQQRNPFGVLLFFYAIYLSLDVLRILSTQMTAAGILSHVIALKTRGPLPP